MRPLRGPVRTYAWGSRTVIATLQGRDVPSEEPEAELWLGAHPSDPSTVDSDGGPVTLDRLVEDDPRGVLGNAVADEFGARLPFLLKLLAADQPLSLQAHPDAAQARTGFANGDPNYVDPYHKPELLVAVSEFEALCGFRDPDESAWALSALAVPQLSGVVAILSGPESVGERLRAAMRMLLEWPAEQRAPLFLGLVDAAQRAGAGALAAHLARVYPNDPGVFVALLLNHVVLRPGDAIWMPAGNLHAYLSGVGVEIMAASDNVLRGGLTPKRVDVGALLHILRFEVLDDPLVPAVPVVPGVVTWPAPVREFRLLRTSVNGAVPEVTLDVPGARIAFCLRGTVDVTDGSGPLTLTAGQSAFGEAGVGPTRVTGAGELYLATTPF